MSERDWVVINVVVHYDALVSLLSVASELGFDLSAYEEPIENERAEDGYQVRVLSERSVEVQFFAETSVLQLADQIAALRNKVLSPPISAVSFAAREWDGNESVDAWKSQHTPIDIDGQLLLCPYWVTPPPFSGVVIRTAPGGAFGSGQHVSTRDSLRCLLRHLRRGETVADLGAGSGMLSVTARRLGSGPILAIEADRADEIERLARLNDVDGITVITNDWHNVDLTGISLLVANISATDARDLVEQVAYLSPHPRLILSGIALWSLDPVAAAIPRAGYHILDRCSEDGEWVTLYIAVV